ncbi:MAG: hypothetical protein JW891_03980 [Candidatus Lokiarchaeota archaeon]|nr:hypothetical protein [Candidatus Lokiarchaeota archaeon]
MNVTCPICQKKKKFYLPRNILKKNGLTTISIPKDTVCTHHFQAFIDKDLQVRGYQKVDFELLGDFDSTSFQCQLCNADINFKLSDESTYLSKEIFQHFLGTELYSIKVAHYSNNELHVNTVLVEEDGTINNILNSHSVKLENYENKELIDLKFFKFSEDNHNILEKHPLFDLFVLFNVFDNWIYELVCLPVFNSLELINIVHKKIQEAISIYSKIPSYLSVSIADKIFHLWIDQSNVICVNLRNELNFQWFNPLVSEFIDRATMEGTLISNCPRFLLISDFFQGNLIPENKITMIKRLINDDLLYSSVRVKYPDRIERISNKLIAEFGISKSFILGFFYQDKNIIDFIKLSEKKDKFEDFIEMIDYINRRKLLE